MFKLTRAFAVAAVLSSGVLCAPVRQDAGKPISAGQSADPSVPAKNVFGTIAQDPNYQSHPTALCIVPAMAKDAGLSQGQEQLVVKQALELCSEAKTIVVSSKSLKRSQQLPNSGVQAHPPNGEFHPVRAVDGQPLQAGAPQSASPQDLPPHPEATPHPSPNSLPAAPHQARDRSSPAPLPNSQAPPKSEHLPPRPVARSDPMKLPNDEHPSHPMSSPVLGAPQPHAARDLQPQPKHIPKQPAVPQPKAPHPVGARSKVPHPNPEVPHPNVEVPPEPSSVPPHHAAVRSAPEQPPNMGVSPKPVQNAPATRPLEPGPKFLKPRVPMPKSHLSQFLN
ncbi:unnamed protein product [Rhizoctonia solani]|uniref:Uncharacterized protein n=1 Tax=Rhizoctonia solani TaxID=456999 RepID=A0A8H2WBE9_9AGAM|nr:unnamed protein product [Rhizoctonia solani]